MNVSLTPQMEESIHKKVESGLYQTASEVVREALRLLDERDQIHAMRLEQLRKEIAVGLDQLERGQSTVYDDESLKELFERIKREGRKKLAEQNKKQHEAIPTH